MTCDTPSASVIVDTELPISTITIAGLDLRLSPLTDVAAQRTASIITFLETTLCIPANESSVRTRIDQFTLSSLHVTSKTEDA
jgi:hypothetical protein